MGEMGETAEGRLGETAEGRLGETANGRLGETANGRGTRCSIKESYLRAEPLRVLKTQRSDWSIILTICARILS
jgi:hypothetical protein